MSLSKTGIQQLLREYFEDYNIESRFIYAFGGEQFLIKESVNRSEGVSKHAIINLFNEYMSDYNIRENFIYDMQNCHFLIALQTAVIKKLADNQTIITSKSANGFKKPVSKTDDEYPDIHYCKLKNTHCIHADTINNKEIGYTKCHGEYCKDDKEPYKTIIDDKGFKHNDKIGRSGFGENEILG